MKTAAIISSVYLIFMGVCGYLFGQLFFGRFTLAATMAGVFGVLAGAITLSSKNETASRLALISSLLAGLGFVMDVHTYYTKLNSPGNDYAWELKGPFLLALAVIAYKNLRRASQ